MKYKIENFTITLYYSNILTIELSLDVILDIHFNFTFEKNEILNNIKHIRVFEDLLVNFKFSDVLKLSNSEGDYYLFGEEY